MSDADRIRAYSFLKAFADDGTIDAHELRFMEKLALKDGVVDEAEIRVLSKIFARLDRDKVSADVWAEIQELKRRYRIP